jgi:uncharacterized membrane protein
MKTRFTGIEKGLARSVGFSIGLLAVRLLYTKNDVYIFYLWNIFLALVPLLCSRRLLIENRIGVKSVLLFGGWLLFLPNAPYLVTDLFHFQARSDSPAWFDMILVTSASWNGVAIGIISLLQVEYFMKGQFSKKWVRIISYSCILLCGYGIYLGRFLRYNSWDVVTDPIPLFSSVYQSVRDPAAHSGAWAFTLIFSGLLAVMYGMIKQLQRSSRTGWW